MISDVQPELRLKMVENNMKNFGFYGIRSRYEIIPKKRNPRKARISYRVDLPEPFRYGTIQLWGWQPDMDTIVRASMRFSELKTGEQYDINILNEERQRISDRLRNRGYYFFQPDYIEFLVDTTVGNKIADVRISLKQGIPANAFQVYKIRNVDVVLTGNEGLGGLDSMVCDSVKIIYEPPVTLKSNVLVRAVKVRPGQTYSAIRQSRTQAAFVQLGVFKFANMTITVPDSIGRNVLDMQISGDFALPIETEIETDVSSKSNNLLGPGLTLGVTNRNMFKRAETFGVRLTGSYEWQIGGNKEATGNSGLMNSYELGLNFNLSVPRLLIPRFLQSKRDRREQTQFQIGTDLLNRHNYFRMISFWGSATYDFNSSYRNYHSVVPFKLNYTYLLRTSQAFDSVTLRNPAVAQSFRNQFIPSMSYTYTYDRTATYRNPNRLFWQTSLTQAGNIIAGVQYLAGNPFGKDTADEISAYLTLRRSEPKESCGTGREAGLLFTHKGKRITEKRLTSIVREKLMNASVAKKSPHVLRHTFATTLLNHGSGINSVKELLGHASIATTQIYTHLSFAELKKNYSSAHPREKK